MGCRPPRGDVAWTLDAARDPATGYPARLTSPTAGLGATCADDSTLTLRFSAPPPRFPDVLTDLAILPAHLLDTVPRARLRQAAWNAPGRQRPFPFRRPRAQPPLGLRRQPGFPAGLGGPPKLERFIVVVVDEPTTKLAALTAGELDMAGIQPAHAVFVQRDPARGDDLPAALTYGIVLNTRRPPFDRLRSPHARPRARPARDRGRLSLGSAPRLAGPFRPMCPAIFRWPDAAVRPTSSRRTRRVRAAHRRERRGRAGADGAGAARAGRGSR